MPPFGPTKRKDLICGLKALGFRGPFAGGRHQFMVREDIVLHIPNPHRGDIGRDLLARILRQGGIDKGQWERL